MRITSLLILSVIFTGIAADAFAKQRTCHTKYNRANHSSTTICK